MAWQEVPVDSRPNCKKNVRLELGGKRRTLSFFFRFNPVGRFWTMDLSDAETGAALVTDVPLVCGEGNAANLLHPYAYKAIGRAVVAPRSDAEGTDRPGLDGLGTEYLLCWEG